MLIVKFALLSSLIISLARATQGFLISYDDPFLQILSLLLEFKYVFLASIAVLSAFMKKRLGWIIIQSYFYFHVSDLVFTAWGFYDWFESEPAYFIYYGIVMPLTLLLILLMNKKIFTKTFGIEKNKLILRNLVAFTIGVVLMVLFFYLKDSFFTIALSRIKSS